MRAAIRRRYGGPTVVELVDRARPEPGANDVLVEVHASSVNTADLDHLLGRPRLVRLFTGPRRPRIEGLGLDVAGIVVSVGDEVTEFAPGDRVFGDMFAGGFGGFAEYVCAPPRAFTTIPPGVSLADAATIPHSAVLALQALEGRGPVKPGSRVLINGAGGMVGPWAIQLAKRFGAHVTAVDRADTFELMRRAGADECIDFEVEDFRSRGLRFDLIVDVAATRGTLAFRTSLTDTGVYMHIARGLLGFFQAALVGGVVSLFSRKRMGVFNWVASRRSDLERLGAMVESGEIAPIVDRVVTLDEIPAALDLVHRHAAKGKVVISMR